MILSSGHPRSLALCSFFLSSLLFFRAGTFFARCASQKPAPFFCFFVYYCISAITGKEVFLSSSCVMRNRDRGVQSRPQFCFQSSSTLVAVSFDEYSSRAGGQVARVNCTRVLPRLPPSSFNLKVAARRDRSTVRALRTPEDRLSDR